MSINIKEFGNLEPVTSRDDERLIKEETKERMKKYNKEHKKEIKEHAKRYNETHRRKTLILGTLGEEGFAIHLLQTVTEFGEVAGVGSFGGVRTPEQNRLSSSKYKLKGVTTLNEWFPDSEAHHMAKDIVIFIPKELHQSVRHNLETGKNMEEINGKALIWAGSQTNE